MNLRLASLILWCAGGILIVASAATILWVVLGSANPVLIPSDVLLRTVQAEPIRQLPDLSDFEVIWTHDVRPELRSSMAEQPVVVTDRQASAPFVNTLPFQLLGTAVESGRSDAVFLSKDGPIVVVRVGDRIDNAKVLRIELNRVVLERDGQRMTVLVPGEDWVNQVEEFES